jgi:hypothetical protein
MTARRSGLSAVRRRRRLRMGWLGALRVWWRWVRKSRCCAGLGIVGPEVGRKGVVKE